ncbi:MAG: AbrB family transcriptional regulator [Campylobacteraceae bacterium]
MREKVIYFLKMLLLLLIGLLGVFVFKLLHLPLPWLLGPIVISAIVTRYPKLPIARPAILSIPARLVLGLAIGSTFTPAIFPYISSYLYSLIFIFPFVILIAIFGTWYYIRVAKMDVMTAFFSTMPGGLLEMVTFGEAKGANVRAITLTQSARLLMLVVILPFIIEIFFHIPLNKSIHIAPAFSEVSYLEMLIMAVVATIGWKVAERFKMAGSVLIGSMIAGAVAYSFGVLTHKPPEEFLFFAQLVLGIMVGSSFKGVSKYELFITLRAAFGFFLILTVICLIFVGIVYYFTDFDLVSIMLAFSPGGQTEMMIIAMVIASNIPYIALHHVTRIFLIMAISPIFAHWLDRKKR